MERAAVRVLEEHHVPLLVNLKRHFSHDSEGGLTLVYDEALMYKEMRAVTAPEVLKVSNNVRHS